MTEFKVGSIVRRPAGWPLKVIGVGEALHCSWVDPRNGEMGDSIFRKEDVELVPAPIAAPVQDDVVEVLAKLLRDYYEREFDYAPWDTLSDYMRDAWRREANGHIKALAAAGYRIEKS